MNHTWNWNTCTACGCQRQERYRWGSHRTTIHFSTDGGKTWTRDRPECKVKEARA